MRNSRSALHILVAGVAGLLAFGAAGCSTAVNGAVATATPWRAAFPDADSLRVTTVARGVEHVFAWNAAGPWAIHVLAIDASLCGPRIMAVHAGPPLTAAAGTSELGRGGIAAMNADFFALPAGTPVGAQVTDGVVVIGPGLRPVFAVDATAYWLGRGVLSGSARHGTDAAAVGQVNRPRTGDARHPASRSLTMFTHWWGRPTTVDSAAVTLGIRVFEGTASRGRGVVTASTRSGTMALGPGRIALQGDAAEDAGPWLARRAVGDTVSWDVALVPERDRTDARARAALQAVGGFPTLLENGRVADPGEPVGATFGPVRHPRTAIGWRDGGRMLLWVVVDGRQAPYSDGMTLAEVTALFQQLGATDAINLDGGGSTTLVVNGQIVNRISDRNGERAVGNAVVLQSCRAR